MKDSLFTASQNSSLADSDPSSPQIKFLKRFILRILQKNLSRKARNEEQLEQTIRSILTYSKTASEINKKSPEFRLPFSELHQFSPQILSLLQIKTSEKTKAARDLSKSLQTWKTSPISAKAILVPYIERLCEIKVTEIGKGKVSRGRISQSRTDLNKFLLEVLLDVLVELLQKVSKGDFQQYVQIKLRALKGWGQLLEAGERGAVKEEMREFGARLVLKSLKVLKSHGQAADVVEKVTVRMRRMGKGQWENYGDELYRKNRKHHKSLKNRRKRREERGGVQEMRERRMEARVEIEAEGQSYELGKMREMAGNHVRKQLIVAGQQELLEVKQIKSDKGIILYICIYVSVSCI